MIFFILSIIIASIISIQQVYDLEDKLAAFFFSLLFFGLCSMLFCFLISPAYGDIGYDETITELLSVKDSVSSSGQFVLGTGMIDSEIHYFSYIKSGEGYKVLKIKGGDDLQLIEQDTMSAMYKDRSAKMEPRFWGFAIGSTPDRVLIVPTGTIIKGINELDLQ